MADSQRGRLAYTRTRAEHVRTVAVSFALGTGLVAGLGLVVGVVARTVNARLGGHLPAIGWDVLAATAAVVGCLTAAAVAVLARPRLVLAGAASGTGVSAGYGQPWVRPDGVPPVGPARDPVEVTR